MFLSAKLDTNVTEAFLTLAEDMIRKLPEPANIAAARLHDPPKKPRHRLTTAVLVERVWCCRGAGRARVPNLCSPP